MRRTIAPLVILLATVAYANLPTRSGDVATVARPYGAMTPVVGQPVALGPTTTTTPTSSTTTTSGATTTTTTTTTTLGSTTTTTLGPGTTWLFDPSGNDSAAGTAGAPWRTFGKFTKAINAGTIKGNDTVKFKPGRYAACEGLDYVYEGFDTGGGAAGAPVLVTVDTGTAGNVEIHGGARSGICGVPAWTQAKKCTTGSFIDSACDSSTECGGGTCSDMTGVYWTVAGLDNNGMWFGGIMAGVAYQPAVVPGDAPKIFEKLYSQAGSARVKMPLFTSGRAQAMPYPTQPPAGLMAPYCTAAGAPWACCRAANVGCEACTADKTPWFCCTGLGSGSCSNSRIYVQTETGVRPDLAGDASFGPVEFPFKPGLFWNGTTSGPPLQYITFSNGNNGRLFHFRWALTNITMMKNAQGLTFEDFDFGYTSRANSFAHSLNTFVANGSNFPPYAAGDTYMVSGWPSSGGTNVVRNISFRRGKIHGSPANEAIHFIGGPVDTHTNLVFEQLEIGDTPFAPIDGTSGTTLTPNAYTNQVQKSWPPPGYTTWASVFPTHWGPLGGGGNSDGQLISSSNAHTFRNNYFHDGGLISFFESGGSGDLIFENNTVDLARMYYSDGSGSPGFYPNALISNCGAPTGCGGLEGRLSLAVPVRFEFPNRKGAVVRNNLFLNTYANAIRTGVFKNYAGEPDPPYKPDTPAMIVNNTFHLKPDFRQAAAGGCNLPVVWFWDAGAPATWTMTDTSNRKLVFKNNIFVRDASSTCNLPIFQIDPSQTTQIDSDYNNWGGQFGAWRVGNTTYTSFATFKTAMQAIAGGTANESHSIDANPLFTTPYSNLGLTVPSSPSYQTGLDLHLSPMPFTIDFEGTARPNGLWSMGAYQGAATGTTVIPTTTTSSTGATTTTTTGTTTTTVATTTTTVATTTSTTLTGSAPNWTSSMVAVWNLDEGSGTRFDATGNGHNFTQVLGTMPGNDTGNKMQGVAAILQQGTGGMRYGPDNAVGTPTVPFAIGCWARPTNSDAADANNQRIFSSYDFNVGGWFLDWVNASNSFHFTAAKPFGVWTSAGAGANGSIGTWKHVVGLLLSDRVRLYVNGSQSGTDTVGAAGFYVPDTGDWIHLGQNEQDLENYMGQLDECFLFQGPLGTPAACRICSCGIDGSLCTCSGATYTSNGRNAAACSSCTLPACNQATP